ncbi:MAG: sigma-70 family RNA polymerase sigma factor [Candidatus Aminicenantes bacterium]|nr:sigma-70 family RNA polymerase sigma factor [Candidatus Aminicenantes bacterium]NIN18369.1 sigma-70 family RNA polymerase sigma factor [Candidatus Aminicenantes bacterium]NIN85022.1 sigma-70 family RNA polymerase sigma factor [Candidatus Aminicenantes bacterium]NIO81218.1 sigma-70 family RNA polymerase sigma factor [Candidatus Aminicenantes bacterium]NIQ67070.1 sigma-70 family RNA polymerase sigma factor [Candidatus Aminicenantes bacterium]
MKKEIRINNLAAFDDLYKEYFNALYRFNYTLVGNVEEALDSTQETFIKLYRQLDTGIEIRDPKAWIYRVAANICYNHLKRKKLFQHIKKANLQPDITPGDIEENLMKKQEIKMLRKAINQLPARDRVILMLYKNGFSTLEIAGVIGVKKNSVGKILARSVEKLSKLIKQGDAR